ncbi:alpha/beta fold hydrolase [Thalassomonas actiniarum]|uniref:Alpha/beta hydrolase n=1 Tax=Thalassomonas actiniarum TaxID=485447 RepID=A0AAF0C4W6_9GAMM|nr:alpha/beta hydrolase [Thalassomonas actiniarum]WDE00913.1 alpha/beta hydrolase [Thalassomonas actiniarum]
MAQDIKEQAKVCYDLGQLELHGLTCGEPREDIVLCLHGWLDNAASFLPLMPYLPGKRVIAIDWPGHGLSTHRSADAYYHFIDWVYDLLQLFEANGWGAVDIVAHSMGGMIASAFAATFPEKVKSLTLIDAIGFINANEEQTTKQLRQGMLSRLQGKKKQKSLHITEESAIQARVAVSDLRYQDAALIVKRGLKKTGDGYTWRADSRLRMISPYRLTLGQAEQLISDIEVPVQLIYGEQGMDFVASGLKHFGPMFKDFTSYALPGGHHVHMEQPQQTAEKILAFIQQR